MDSGQVDKGKYRHNMELADVYINRVNNCPCGDTVIHMYRGADSSDEQEKRKYILQYLKGSKEALRTEVLILQMSRKNESIFCNI